MTVTRPALISPSAPRREAIAGARKIGVQAHTVILPGKVPRREGLADLTRRFADLIVGFGANVQPGQIVGVTTNPGKEELTREVARSAYERGAHWVDVFTPTRGSSAQRLAHADGGPSSSSRPG